MSPPPPPLPPPPPSLSHDLHHHRHRASSTTIVIARPPPPSSSHVLHHHRHRTSSTTIVIARPPPPSSSHVLLHHRHRTSHNVNAQSSAACARELVTLKRLWLPLNSRQLRHSHSFLCVVLTRVESQVRTLTFAQEVCARCGSDLNNAVLSLRALALWCM